jgi:flagellar hook assembly protein FlgD
MSPITNSGLNLPTTDTKKPKDLKDLDINQFLQLMIAELTNQDPLNPMDNTQLVQQIGAIREISATDKLTDSLDLVQSGQSLSTASSLSERMSKRSPTTMRMLRELSNASRCKSTRTTITSAPTAYT